MSRGQQNGRPPAGALGQFGSPGGLPWGARGENILIGHEGVQGIFGRILGNFKTINGDNVADKLMKEGHAVAYNGGDKENVQKQHLVNRQKLIDEGKVPTPDGMTLTPNKVNTFKATKPPLRKKRSKKK